MALFSTVLLAGCQTSDQDAAEQSASSKSETAMESSASDTSSENQADSSSEEAKEQTFLYEVNPDNYNIDPIKEDTESKVALITIDDAPDKHAVEMAQKLKDINAPAVFFINGMYIESDEGKEDLKKIYDMGFEIGNHTQTHANLKEISEEKQKEEILRTSELIEEVTGEKPRFFRAPFGSNTDFSRSLAKQEKMTLMNWTYGYDWEKKYQDSAALKDIMLNTEYLRDGANLLMHDRDWTNDAIVDIAEGLRDKGYTLVDPATIISEGSEDGQNE